MDLALLELGSTYVYLFNLLASRVFSAMNVTPTDRYQPLDAPPLSCDTSAESNRDSYFLLFVQKFRTILNRDRMPRNTVIAICPVIPILIIAGVHFVFASMGMVAYLNMAYIFTHIILVLMAVWCSIDKVALEPVVAFMFVLSFSGFIDILVLAIFWDDFTDNSSSGTFSGSMMIINLLLKPTTFLCCILPIYARTDGFNFSNYFQRYTQQGYSNLEEGGNQENS